MLFTDPRKRWEMPDEGWDESTEDDAAGPSWEKADADPWDDDDLDVDVDLWVDSDDWNEVA